MWVFSDFGLLMPALVPERAKNRKSVRKWTKNGKYELQVRARLREHLKHFMEVYMEPGTYNPKIHATPEMDYNYRFYTTREAFAQGIANIALNMDYEKFKETSERFPWNKKYHTLLTRIWGTLCELNPPGGIWGKKSKENPRGFSKAWDEYDSYWPDSMRRVGDSFRNVQFEEDEDYSYDYRADWDDAPLEHVDFGGVEDRDTIDLINELDNLNIPEENWHKYTSPAELASIVTVLKRAGLDNQIRKIMTGVRESRVEDRV